MGATLWQLFGNYLALRSLRSESSLIESSSQLSSTKLLSATMPLPTETALFGDPNPLRCGDDDPFEGDEPRDVFDGEGSREESQFPLLCRELLESGSGGRMLLGPAAPARLADGGSKLAALPPST